MAFWTITLCVIVSVVASVLAIWDFAVTQVLWRTVATCLVLAAGTAVFVVLNYWFGARASGGRDCASSNPSSA